MRSLSFSVLLLCKALLDYSSVTAEEFDDLETGSDDIFATNDFGDPLTQSESLPTDPLAYNDISLFTDPLAYNDISTPLLPGSGLLADSASLGCSSSDTTQDQFIGKRLDPGTEEKPRLCLPQRSNPGKYPNFDPENDPLIQIMGQDPEDEEFCPSQLYSRTFLVCDSGYFVDRKWNSLTGLYHLNRCQRSKISAHASSLSRSLGPCLLLGCLPPCRKNPRQGGEGKWLTITQSTE